MNRTGGFARLFEAYVAEPLQLPFEVQARIDGPASPPLDLGHGVASDAMASAVYCGLFDSEEPIQVGSP